MPHARPSNGEDPRRSVEREALEELGIRPAFHDRLGGGQPFFVSVTKTSDHSHTDVALWLVLTGDRTAELRPDTREFRDIRWFGLDDQTDWPADRFDQQMHRFASKLKSALDGADRS
jgi:8-oxo-dGTP diphosphatase